MPPGASLPLPAGGQTMTQFVTTLSDWADKQ
jgi:hypothetical protein